MTEAIKLIKQAHLKGASITSLAKEAGVGNITIKRALGGETNFTTVTLLKLQRLVESPWFTASLYQVQGQAECSTSLGIMDKPEPPPHLQPQHQHHHQHRANA